MTDSNIVLNDEVYQSFSALRLSIDALVCAADLIPVGGDDESLGRLFRLLSSHLDSDLNAHFQTLCSSRS